MTVFLTTCPSQKLRVKIRLITLPTKQQTVIISCEVNKNTPNSYEADCLTNIEKR